MTTPTPNTPLTADDVKLLRKGDWLVCVVRPETEGLWSAIKQPEKGQAVQVAATRGGTHVELIGFLSNEPPRLFGWLQERFHFLGRPDQSGWIPHAGGPNPAPGLRVDVRFLDESEDREGLDAECFGWSREECLPITHWRPHVPAPAGEDHGIKGILGLPVRESDDTPPCFECGSTERTGTACAPCNPELASAPAGEVEPSEDLRRDWATYQAIKNKPGSAGETLGPAAAFWANVKKPEAKARIEALEADGEVYQQQADHEFRLRKQAEAQRDEAVKALEEVKARAKVMRNAHKLVGPRAFENDPRGRKAWADDRYVEGKDLMKLVNEALASIKGKTNEQG